METTITKLIEKYPVYLYLLLFGYLIWGIIQMLQKIKELNSGRDSKITKLLFLKDKINDKDDVLKEFTQDRIEEEVFFQITGLSKTSKKYVMLVEFYVRNKAILTWEEIRKVISAFKVEDDKLLFCKRNFWNKIGTTLYFIYFGLAGLSFGVMILYELISKKDYGTSFLYFILYVLSLWMIMIKKNEIDVIKKIKKNKIS